MDIPVTILYYVILHGCFLGSTARFLFKTVIIQMLMEHFRKLVILAIAVAKQVNVLSIFRFADDIIIFSLVNDFVIPFPINFFCFGNDKLHQVQFICLVAENRFIIFLPEEIK